MFARLKGVGRWVKTVKGLRSANWQLENSHRNVVSGGVMAMRAARGTRLMEDHCTGYINV